MKLSERQIAVLKYLDGLWEGEATGRQIYKATSTDGRTLSALVLRGLVARSSPGMTTKYSLTNRGVNQIKTCGNSSVVRASDS